MPFPTNRLATLFSMLALAAFVAGCAQPGPTAQTVAAPERSEYQVFFDIDSAALDARGRAVVASVAAVASRDEKMSVRVIGKTDRLGSPPVNMALSKRRAEAVLAALVAAGMPTARIDWGWIGERAPEVATADDKVEPRNRVVEITVAKEAR